VTVAVPAPCAVTSPDPFTVATPPLLVDHVTTRPLNALPAASRGVAVNCWPAPTTNATVAGVTSTLATETWVGVTVTVDVPLSPSDAAVIVTDPSAAPETSPVPLTDATLGAELDHSTVRPVSSLPDESLIVAVSRTVLPTSIPALPGTISTDATGASVTVTVVLSLNESAVALTL
jgi:hypothetical protein